MFLLGSVFLLMSYALTTLGLGQDPVLCRENEYFNVEQKQCQECGCNDLGSASLQCDDFGMCKCVAEVTGPKCELSPTWISGEEKKGFGEKVKSKVKEEFGTKEFRNRIYDRVIDFVLGKIWDFGYRLVFGTKEADAKENNYRRNEL